MTDQPPSEPRARIRLVPDGRVKISAPCPPVHEAAILEALSRTTLLRAELSEPDFRALAGSLGVPSSIIDRVIRELFLDDSTYLRPPND